MNALRLDPSGYNFAQLYEPRPGPRFSRKTLLVTGIVALCYGALGVYVMSQKYGPMIVEQPVAEPPVIVDWVRELPKPKPTPVTKQQPTPVRRADTSTTPTVPPLPLAPTDGPITDVRPTVAPTAPTTPTAEPTAEPTVRTAPGLIRNPVWINRPTPAQVERLYPEKALELGMSGTVTLLCGIRANGAMTGCQVLDETPSGMRFGAAALSMARYFKIRPTTLDDVPVEGAKVRIPIVFNLD